MRNTLLALCCACVAPVFASGVVTLQGVEFRVDTIDHYNIGPGVTQSHLALTTQGRRVDIFAATVDKNTDTYKPTVSTRIEIARDHCRGTEGVSQIAMRKSGPESNRQYLSALNADFFQMCDVNLPWWGWPVSGSIVERQIASNCNEPWAHRTGIVISPEGMWIDDVSNCTYSLSSIDGAHTINPFYFNLWDHVDDQLRLHNKYTKEGIGTEAPAGYRELGLQLAEGAEWKINSDVRLKVVKTWSTDGNMTIPENGLVISAGPNYNNDWIFDLKEGDEINYHVDLFLPNHNNLRPDITFMATGDVRILCNGNITTPEMTNSWWWYGSPYQDTVYARAMAGFSENRDKIIMVNVSGGGATGSTGLRYFEQAELMRWLGCHDAVNFDGGGSSSLWVTKNGVVSLLRDLVERPVGNGIFFAIDAPYTETVSDIRFFDHAATIPLFASYLPKVYGYNEHGQLVETDVQGFNFESSDNYEAKGNIAVADKPGMHAFNIVKDGMRATIPVMVTDINPIPAYPFTVIDTRHHALPNLQSVADGIVKPVDGSAFTWASSNPAAAEVNAATGELTGLSRGTATITGSRGDVNIQFNVSVEIPDAEYLKLDPAFGDASYTIKTVGIDNVAVTPNEAGDAWQLTFKNTQKRGLSMDFAKDIVVYALPERFVIDINTNGSKLPDVKLNVEAANCKGNFQIHPSEVLSNGGRFVFDISEAFDVTDHAFYPLTFKSITIDPLFNDNNSPDFKFDITGLGFEYDYYEASLAEVAVNNRAESLPVTISGGIITTPLNGQMELFSADGRLLQRGTTLSVPATHGIYIVRAAGLSAKIRL